MLLLGMAVLSGCGPRFGTVEGTVTVDGKPANDGTVIFSVGDLSAAGTIHPDGSYTAEKVPPGEARIVIHQMMLMGGATNQPGRLPGIDDAAPTAKPVPIPKKYQSVETSGLSYTITSGTNEINIELSSR
jgi:hypothetical protein